MVVIETYMREESEEEMERRKQERERKTVFHLKLGFPLFQPKFLQ